MGPWPPPRRLLPGQVVGRGPGSESSAVLGLLVLVLESRRCTSLSNSTFSSFALVAGISCYGTIYTAVVGSATNPGVYSPRRAGCWAFAGTALRRLSRYSVSLPSAFRCCSHGLKPFELSFPGTKFSSHAVVTSRRPQVGHGVHLTGHVVLSPQATNFLLCLGSSISQQIVS